ncbi:MAG: hypothetical protein AAB965_01640 [Patescibacteria group bacterium]
MVRSADWTKKEEGDMTDLEQKDLLYSFKHCKDEGYRVRITLKSGNVVGGPETLVFAVTDGIIHLVTSQPPKDGRLVSSSSYVYVPVSHIDFFENLMK